MTWVETNPDFTECFKQTVLIWVPCLFLILFAPLDLYFRSRSRYSDIPLSLLFVLKSIASFLLICLTFADMAMMLNWRFGDEASGVTIYNVQFVSVGVKAFSFVSISSIDSSIKC